MNQKSGDFAQYSLPRLSVYSNDPTRDDRGESRKVDNSISISISNKSSYFRVKLKRIKFGL